MLFTAVQEHSSSPVHERASVSSPCYGSQVVTATIVAMSQWVWGNPQWAALISCTSGRVKHKYPCCVCSWNMRCMNIYYAEEACLVHDYKMLLSYLFAASLWHHVAAAAGWLQLCSWGYHWYVEQSHTLSPACQEHLYNSIFRRKPSPWAHKAHPLAEQWSQPHTINQAGWGFAWLCQTHSDNFAACLEKLPQTKCSHYSQQLWMRCWLQGTTDRWEGSSLYSH